jgi:uncharacterized membrane protein
MDTVQDPCACGGRRGVGAASAGELAAEAERAHLVRQVAVLATQLGEARSEVTSLRTSIERMMTQRDAVDEAIAVVEAELDRAGAEGAL